MKNEIAKEIEALATAGPRKAVAIVATSPRYTYQPQGIGKTKPH